MFYRYWKAYNLSLKIIRSWYDMLKWCRRLYMRVIWNRSDDVTKTKFVKSRDGLAHPGRTL